MTDMKLPIYLDYSSTTPVDERVAEAMMKCLTLDGNYGNPASRSHSFGWSAEKAVEEAREHVAALIQADPKEIIWTSGATESDNLAIKGAAHFYQKERQTYHYLQDGAQGYTGYLSPAGTGRI